MSAFARALDPLRRAARRLGRGSGAGPRIFLSYRRDDSSGHAGRLYDALAARFGSGNVFMDVDAIAAGSDFSDEIDRALAGCDVAVAVIGRNWASAAAADGKRRLDDHADVLRLELERALAHDLVVIPALVQDAELPAAAELPPSLEPLVRRQAIDLRDASWRDDVARLVRRLEAVERRSRSSSRPGAARGARVVVAAALAVAAVAAAAATAITLAGADEDRPGEPDGTAPAGAASRLLAVLPAALRPDCNEVDWGPEAALTSLSCSGGSVSATYHLFESLDVLRSWYELSRDGTDIDPDSGECIPSAFSREGPHRIDGEIVGRYFCFMDGDEPNVYWTDERALVAAEAATWNGKGAEGAERLLRQWRCCFQLEPGAARR